MLLKLMLRDEDLSNFSYNITNMKFPRIRRGPMLDFQFPEDYKALFKRTDDNFKRETENLFKFTLEEWNINPTIEDFHWDDEIGLEAIHLGEGSGAYFIPDKRKWVYKNIDRYYQALAVFNMISLYLNRLEEYRE